MDNVNLKELLRYLVFIPILVLSVWNPAIAGGNQVVDSLLIALDQAKDGSDKVDLLLEISFEYQQINLELAVNYANKGLELAENIKYKKGIANASYKLGNALMLNRDFANAEKNLTHAQKAYQQLNDSLGLANCYLLTGGLVVKQGNFEKAIDLFNQSIAIAAKINAKDVIAKCYRNLGVVEAYQSNYDTSIEFFEKTMALEDELDDKVGVSTCLTNIGIIYNYKGNHIKSLEYQEKALAVSEQIGDKKAISVSLVNLGASYDDQGMYDKALDCYEKALALKTELEDKPGISICYNNMGEVHLDRGDYAKAIEYYEKSLKIDQELEDNPGMAICLMNIGHVHFLKSDFNKALDYYEKSLSIAEKADEKRILANVLNYIGELKLNQKKFSDALISLEKSLDYAKQIGEQSVEAQSVFLIGSVYLRQGDFKNASGHFNEALNLHLELGEQAKVGDDYVEIARADLLTNKMDSAILNSKKANSIGKEIGSKELVQNSAELLSKIYARLHNYTKAYQYMIEFKEVHDSIYTLESTKQINLVEHRFELERKQNEIELQKSQLEKQEILLSRQKLEQNTLIGILLASFTIIIVIVISYLRTQKDKILITRQRDQIEESMEELNQTNEELKVTVETVNKQKVQIEKKNKEITDSIKYAQYIQRAILPKKEDIDRLLKNCFVLYLPKDIVSGDFYWLTEVEDHTVVAAVDCTGHGVPGAFMSMLGLSYLNDIVNKEYITHTGVILRRLRKEVIKALQQKGELGEQRDGMDISICSIDYKEMKLQFSGAHNPLYIIRSLNKPVINEANSLIMDNWVLYEIKGDAMPIALYEKMERFQSFEIDIMEGDRIYMFSDGYADQFGGSEGKRLRSKPFKEILLTNCTLAMEQQKIILERSFDQWKQNHQQIDDVMVLGFEIN